MTSPSENIKNIAVSDFMTRKVKIITENETMRQACKLMYQHNIGSIVILKEGEISSNTTRKEIPVGIVTERDIARMIGFSAQFFADMPVSVMNKPLITVNPYTSVKDAVSLMEQKDIRRLPVVDDDKGQMVGIITAKDILKAVMNSFKEVMKSQDLTSEGFDLLGLLGTE
jgi:CBS domain-containing protein